MTIKELEEECKKFQNKVDGWMNGKITLKNSDSLKNWINIIEELVNEIKTRKIANMLNPGTYQ